jgi:hypothetical protein
LIVDDEQIKDDGLWLACLDSAPPIQSDTDSDISQKEQLADEFYRGLMGAEGEEGLLSGSGPVGHRGQDLGGGKPGAH